MPIVLEPFSERHVPAVRDFNKRISQGGITYRFPESPVPRWLPRRDAIPLYQEGFVAMEDNMVRGGYLLKRQPFACRGELLMTGDYQLPISEGTIDSRYALIGLLMFKDALKREPLLFALGIGGYQESLTRMLKVLNISSIIGLRGYTGLAAYSATKAGLDGMTRSLARELGPRNIRVNAIAPGYLETEMTGKLDERQRDQIIRRTPMGRLGLSEDVIGAVSFLLSPASSFITGQTIVIDGGITC